MFAVQSKLMNHSSTAILAKKKLDFIRNLKWRLVLMTNSFLNSISTDGIILALVLLQTRENLSQAFTLMGTNVPDAIKNSFYRGPGNNTKAEGNKNSTGRADSTSSIGYGIIAP